MTELLKPRTVAKTLCISMQKLRDLVDDGRIEAVRLGPRSMRFRRADIEAIINGPAAAQGIESQSQGPDS